MRIISIFEIFLLLAFIKSVVVGSEFSFWKWIKYGKLYTHWYFNRPEFEDELN